MKQPFDDVVIFENRSKLINPLVPSATFFSQKKKKIMVEFHWSKTNSTFFVLSYKAALESYSALKFSPVHIFMNFLCLSNNCGHAEFKSV